MPRAANVVDAQVDDTRFDSNIAAYYNILGQGITATKKSLYKFDLSAIPATATISKAQLRLYASSGYGNATCGRIITHNWSELTACMAGPDAPVSPDTTWGPNSDSLFSDADYVTPVSFESIPGGECYLVKDVTADVQDFVDGTAPNYGWYVYVDFGIWTSENLADDRRPALFIAFDPNCDMAPLAITSVTTSNRQLHSLTVNWLAPIDDNGTNNAAAAYDVRYSTSEIDESNWANAQQATGAPVPATPGTPESMVIDNLAPDTIYYFAIKSIDQASNVSAISNCPFGQTYPEEFVPPTDASDFCAVDVRASNLTLNWTATGDDRTTGLATYYDIRMSTNQITESNFDSATVVQHDIVPGEAGIPESLFVNGLTSGATYWFAIKVGDEVYNWSAATIIAVTMPNDQTAPAAISNLAVSGGDAFSANLTWTASGDDGANGTASGYDIRYSTSQIDATNFDSAAVMPNTISPQAAGNTEQFTVSGLQPGTTYYLAIKVKDEVGNTSAISNVETRTTSADPQLPLITTVTITEKAGVTTNGYPVMLSHVFKQGDVANNVIVRVDGQYLATQTDVKVRYPADSSVKHALISFILPTLQANQMADVDILAGGPNANQQPMTRDQLLAKDFDARMTITLNGVPTVISAHELLRHQITVERWIGGDICNEFFIRDFDRNIGNQLNVQYHVRLFNGYNGIRVDTVVENCWSEYRGNIQYDFSLALGQLSPQVVFGKTGFWQYYCTRWHKVFWQVEMPQEIAVRYDLSYLVSTKLLPSLRSDSGRTRECAAARLIQAG